MNLDPVRTGTGLLFSCSQQNYKPIKIQTVRIEMQAFYAITSNVKIGNT